MAVIKVNQNWLPGSSALESSPRIYGDATAEARRTSASRTDWQIVKDFFGCYTDRYRASFRMPSADPPVKNRVNCVNALLRNHIKDLEQACWKADSHGNPLAALDKSDPEFSMRPFVDATHGVLTDAYWPTRSGRNDRFGLRGTWSYRPPT
jgi:hypothetical protein